MTTTTIRDLNLESATRIVFDAVVKATQAFTGALANVTPQNTPDRLVTILTTWAAAVRTVRGDAMSSTPAILAAEKELTKRAAQAVTDLEHLFGVALEAYKRTIAKDLPAIDAGLHMKLWARLRSQLDAGIEPARLIEEADGATLTVLTEELHAWRRVQMPDNLAGADYIFQGDSELLKARRYAIADADQRLRIDIADAAAKGEYRVKISFQQARHALGYLTDFVNRDIEIVIPGWGMTERTVKL